MKVLVCGDRKWKDRRLIFDVLDLIHAVIGIDTIIEGDAQGADIMAGEWASSRGVELRVFPAQWNLYGRAAGPLRNRQQLAEGPDLVLAFHSDLPNSRGTRDMVFISAQKPGVRVVHITDAGKLTVVADGNQTGE